MTVTAPVPASTFPGNDPVTFSDTAPDAEDGDLL